MCFEPLNGCTSQTLLYIYAVYIFSPVEIINTELLSGMLGGMEMEYHCSGSSTTGCVGSSTPETDFDNEVAMYLVWEDVSVMLPNFGNGQHTRRLLDGLTGYAQPTRIMAIMGPSGSGKSTLLDSLSGYFLFLSLFLYIQFVFHQEIMIKFGANSYKHIA